MNEHVHLAYAATAYGVQGTTSETAHTVLSDALDASGLYVGMTRGRGWNQLHVVAETLDEAREQFIGALQLDRSDRGLQAATSDAQASAAGLAAEGPVKVVNDERARLTELIANAEREAVRWEHAAHLLADQAETHAREDLAGRESLAQAEARLAARLDEAVQPLLVQAAADGQAYIDAHSHQQAAWDAVHSSGRLGKRGANRTLDAAQRKARDSQESALARWGSLPSTSKWSANTRDGLDAWAARVAHEHADAVPLVSVARQQVEQSTEAQRQLWQRHHQESDDLRLRVYGRLDAAFYRVTAAARSPKERSEHWRNHAEAARADLAHIESLPVGRAVQFIEAGRVQALKSEHAVANRRSRLDVSEERRLERPDPAPGLGL